MAKRCARTVDRSAYERQGSGAWSSPSLGSGYGGNDRGVGRFRQSSGNEVRSFDDKASTDEEDERKPVDGRPRRGHADRYDDHRYEDRRPHSSCQYTREPNRVVDCREERRPEYVDSGRERESIDNKKGGYAGAGRGGPDNAVRGAYTERGLADIFSFLETVLQLAALTFGPPILLVPLYKLCDFIHSGKYYTEARNAKKYATLLDISYDYYVLKGKDADCIKSWEAKNYELIPSTEYDDEDVRELVESPFREVVALRKIRSESAGNRSSDEPDEIVVLFRETCFMTSRDLWEDLKIPLEVLHSSDRVLGAEKLVKELVSKQVRRYGRHGVRLVGHSLGAAVGIIIARRLHLEDPKNTLEGHFFNLPYMDLETISTELQRVFSNLASSGIHIPHWVPAFGQTLRGMIEAIAEALVTEKTVGELNAEHAKLADFKPNIYINAHDIISKGYIEFFRNSGFERTAFRQSQLCPSANLIISWKGFLAYASHKLDIWKEENERSIRVESYTSLSRDQFTT